MGSHNSPMRMTTRSLGGEKNGLNLEPVAELSEGIDEDMRVKGRIKGDSKLGAIFPVHRCPFRNGISNSGFRKISTLIRIKRMCLIENTDHMLHSFICSFPYVEPLQFHKLWSLSCFKFNF